MRRSLLSFASLVLITILQLFVYPGQHYLASDTQNLVPQLEHLENPGWLGRDPVAVNSDLTYTIYDEVTLSLARIPKLDIAAALLLQQALCRLAAVGGMMLLARSAGASRVWSLVIAGLTGFVGLLPGIALAPVASEATPTTFAFGLTLLSAGLFTRYKPLLAGLVGGLALIYDPRIALALCLVLLAASLFDRRLRPVIRPSLTVFAIFALLLANFAQLQPATTETRTFFERIPAAIEAVQRFRIPHMWVTSWEPRAYLLYLALAALIASGLVKIWSKLGPMLRWLLSGLSIAGVLSIALSYVFLDIGHRRTVMLLEPTHTLLFTAVVSVLVCVIAAIQTPTRERWVFAAGPVLLLAASIYSERESPPPPTHAAAIWAESNTWGASVFLFADAGASPAPGRFRAEGNRAVWVDWVGGKLCGSSDAFADEWQRRWTDTQQGEYSISRLERLLTLPIDYYVLRPEHSIPHVAPAFRDQYWVIYDAHDLRKHFGLL